VPNDVIIGYSGDADTTLEQSLCRVLFVGENDSTGTGDPRYDVVTDCPVTSDTAGNLYTGLSCWEDMLVGFPLTKYLPVYEVLRNVVVLFGITDYSFLIGDADESLVTFFGGIGDAIIACSSQGTTEACEDLQDTVNTFIENGTTAGFQAQVDELIPLALGAANAANFAWYFVNIAAECMSGSTQVLKVPPGGTADDATPAAVTSLVPNDVIIGYSGDADTTLEQSLCRVLFVGENDSTGTGDPRYDVVTDCPVTSDTAGNLYTGLSCWEDMLVGFPLTKYLPVYEVLRNVVVLFGITDYSFLIGDADESLVTFFGGIGDAIIACSSQGTTEACEDLQDILNTFIENGTTADFQAQVSELIQSTGATDFASYLVNVLPGILAQSELPSSDPSSAPSSEPSSISCMTPTGEVGFVYTVTDTNPSNNELTCIHVCDVKGGKGKGKGKRSRSRSNTGTGSRSGSLRRLWSNSNSGGSRSGSGSRGSSGSCTSSGSFVYELGCGSTGTKCRNAESFCNACPPVSCGEGGTCVDATYPQGICEDESEVPSEVPSPFPSFFQ